MRSRRTQDGAMRNSSIYNCRGDEALMTEEWLLLQEENQLCQVSEAKSVFQEEEGVVSCVENWRD